MLTKPFRCNMRRVSRLLQRVLLVDLVLCLSFEFRKVSYLYDEQCQSQISARSGKISSFLQLVGSQKLTDFPMLRLLLWQILLELLRGLILQHVIGKCQAWLLTLTDCHWMGYTCLKILLPYGITLQCNSQATMTTAFQTKSLLHKISMGVLIYRLAANSLKAHPKDCKVRMPVPRSLLSYHVVGRNNELTLSHLLILACHLHLRRWSYAASWSMPSPARPYVFSIIDVWSLANVFGLSALSSQCVRPDAFFQRQYHPSHISFAASSLKCHLNEFEITVCRLW